MSVTYVPNVPYESFLKGGLIDKEMAWRQAMEREAAQNQIALQNLRASSTKELAGLDNETKKWLFGEESNLKRNLLDRELSQRSEALAAELKAREGQNIYDWQQRYGLTGFQAGLNPEYAKTQVLLNWLRGPSSSQMAREYVGGGEYGY